MSAAVLVLAVAVAAALQVVSGFGFSLVVAPVLVALTDPVTSVSIMAVTGTVTNAVTLGTGGRRPTVDRRETVGLLVATAPGLLVGAWLVTQLPADAVRVAVGVLVLAALVQRHLVRRVRRARAGTRAAAGLASGALATSTGLSGPPLVLHLGGAGLDPRAFRDTLAAVFLVQGALSVAILAAAGELSVPTVTAVLPLASLAGGVLGHRLFDRTSAEVHGRIVTVLLVASALTALISAAS